MKSIITFFLGMFISLGMMAQATGTIDFETPAYKVWDIQEDGTNPPLEFVANPDATAPNTSATVAKFTAKNGGQPWALAINDEIGSFTFDATNNVVKMMVYKTRISDVGIKFENGAANFQVLVPNTVINQWEELTFTFPTTGTYIRLVVIPDFLARTADDIVYFDNIQMPLGTPAAVDFTSLNTAIAASTLNSTTVTVSVDGADVLTSADWVLQADLDTYTAAIAAAQAVADNTGAFQSEVNAAVTALAGAAIVFEAAKSAGTLASGVFDVEKAALNIYPNPSNGIFTVNTTNEYTVDVVSTSGKIVKTQVINASSNSIDLTGNEAGVYILNFKNNEQSFPSSVILK